MVRIRDLDLPIRELPEGIELFHGTWGRSSFKTINGPAWFSDSFGVAERFAARYRDPKVLRFTVRKSVPRLVEIGDFEEFIRSVDRSPRSEFDMRRFAKKICNGRFDGWVVPNYYPDGADIMLCNPDKWLLFLGEMSPKG